MVRLSIIIPYYNTEKYTDELLSVLEKQMTQECEVILVDDGSDEPYVPDLPDDMVRVFRQKNKGVSAARNKGLKEAKGEYIAFIDSDDLVSNDYIDKIFDAMAAVPDTIYLSWKSMHTKWGKVLRDDNDEFGTANRCVWNRVFKKTYIEGMKFDESMQIAEDDDFLKKLPKANSKKCITSVVYHYRQNREGGLTNRKAKGEFEDPDIITQVVFYYNWVQEIGGVETFDVRKEDQKIRVHQLYHDGGKTVVFSDGGLDTDLVGGYRVVFVDNGQRVPFQQTGDGVMYMAAAPGMVNVLSGQQDLGHRVAVLGKQLVVGVHQFALAYGSGGLLAGHILRSAGQTQLAHTHADGTGRYQHHLMACVFDVAEHLAQQFYPADVQPPPCMGQGGCANLNDYTHLQSLLA